MTNVFKFSAAMTCSSCSNCITKVLERNQQKGVGITSFNVDLENKLVTVEGTIPKEQITEILSKTGIATSLLSAQEAGA